MQLPAVRRTTGLPLRCLVTVCLQCLWPYLNVPAISPVTRHEAHFSLPPAAATKLLWLKRREPNSWRRLAHALLPHDYINWWLTGRLCMEVR